MFAEVCVDIPAAKVDRLFTYAVPEEYQNVIEVGMRIQVPFGSRQLLAIVIRLLDKQATDFKVKEIHSLLDYHSYLNQELIDLSAYLASELQAYRITVLLAMLPSMFKVKYENIFHLLDSPAILGQIDSEEDKQALITMGQSIDKETFEQMFTQRQISQWLKAGLVDIEYRVLDQQTKKKETWLKKLLDHQAYQNILEKLPRSYHKQVELLECLIKFPEKEILQNDLFEKSNLGRQDIKLAIKKGWISEFFQEVFRNPFDKIEIRATDPYPLKEEQESAYCQIKPLINNHKAHTILLQGVTGSGKTEVYLQLIAVAKQENRGALLLVPEIALTPQMISQVRGRYPEGVAVLHSGLSAAEKYDEWRRIISGQAKIVVGARSSIFAPVQNLGLIVIDEEHETTYKQGDNPRYHARDIAIWRSNYHHCPLILGSATPSLESRARAQKGNYLFIKMDQRVNQRPLPPVDIVDMTKVGLEQAYLEISPQLQAKIEDRLNKKQQTILLLNRRGYASYILCRECGYVIECPNCDISLTYHKSEETMKCHYCDYQERLPQSCPQCSSQHLRSQGIGTQKIVETLEGLYPEARLIRMDNDTTRRKGAHAKLLGQFKAGHADILVGTQMIAKGLDFENVSLVGVINADTSLNIPDFRSSERTFQLLTQVSGRTGRGKIPGEVIIQTYNPEHYVIQLAQKHDYETFFKYEMQYRHLAKYPPYYFMSLVKVSSPREHLARNFIYPLKLKIQAKLAELGLAVILLGPSQSPIAKINKLYNFQVLLKYKDKKSVRQVLNAVFDQCHQDIKRDLYMSLDHEPQFFI